jgi:ubiquinone/menaquinone biosynthesis C-methylase UbiE
MTPQKPLTEQISRYYFERVEHCEMCGDPVAGHKVLGLRLNQSVGLRPGSKSGIAVSVLKCRKCSLIYSQPLPVPFDIQDHYGTPPEEYWKESYFAPQREYFSRQIAEVRERLTTKDQLTALDIGAGLGKCMIALKDAGFDVWGLEPSKPFYDRAIEKMGISPERLALGMVEDLEYPDSSFDFITFGAVLEHLYHPAANIEKAMRWLKPNGIIHIEVPSSKHLIGKIFNLYYRLRGTNYVTNLSPMHVPFHMYEFGLDSFKQLGERLHFTIEHHYTDVCEIMFLPRFTHPFLRKYMEWTNTGMQLTVYLRKK